MRAGCIAAASRQHRCCFVTEAPALSLLLRDHVALCFSAAGQQGSQSLQTGFLFGPFLGGCRRCRRRSRGEETRGACPRFRAVRRPPPVPSCMQICRLARTARSFIGAFKLRFISGCTWRSFPGVRVYRGPQGAATGPVWLIGSDSYEREPSSPSSFLAGQRGDGQMLTHDWRGERLGACLGWSPHSPRAGDMLRCGVGRGRQDLYKLVSRRRMLGVEEKGKQRIFARIGGGAALTAASNLLSLCLRLLRCCVVAVAAIGLADLAGVLFSPRILVGNNSEF